MGYPADTIDADSFTAAADALYAEGLNTQVSVTHHMKFPLFNLSNT